MITTLRHFFDDDLIFVPDITSFHCLIGHDCIIALKQLSKNFAFAKYVESPIQFGDWFWCRNYMMRVMLVEFPEREIYPRSIPKGVENLRKQPFEQMIFCTHSPLFASQFENHELSYIDEDGVGRTFKRLCEVSPRINELAKTKSIGDVWLSEDGFDLGMRGVRDAQNMGIGAFP